MTAVLTAVSIACTQPPPPAGPARAIRVAYSGEADFRDLPSLVAHSRLRAQGYQVEVVYFGSPEVTLGALSRGSADIAHASSIGGWKAVARGAPIRTVMLQVTNQYRLVTRPGIQECADLDGKRLALPTEGSVGTHLVRAFLHEECPSARPEVLLLAGNQTRSAAFMAGGVDAAALELSSLLWLERQAPGRFRVLSDFSTRWPRIKTTVVQANANFARENPAALVDYLRALLATNRDVAREPGLLVSTARAHAIGANEAEAMAAAYLAANAWPKDGGLTSADVIATLEFFKRHSGLDPRLTPEGVADLRFLQEALASPGR